MRDQVLAGALAAFFSLVGLVVIAVWLFLLKEELPGALQVGTAVGFTLWVGLHTFVRSRNGPAYNLSDMRTWSIVPRLAVWHGLFTALAVGVVTLVRPAKRWLPPIWSGVDGRNRSLLGICGMVTVVVLSAIDIRIVRSALGRVYGRKD